MGLALFDSLFLALAISVTSTVIVMRVLEELGMIKDEASYLLLGVAVIEYIIIVSMVAVLQTVALAGHLSIEEIAISISLVLAFIGGVLFIGSKTVPKFVDLLGRTNHSDLVLIGILGVAFGLSFIANQIGVSVATGAFFAGVHPHRPDQVYVVPLATPARYPPNGEFQVWVSNDGGKRWRKRATGLPKKSYFGVLREGMAMDGEDPCGIYLGTTDGEVFCSTDEGNSWHRIAEHLPRIYSVSCV